MYSRHIFKTLGWFYFRCVSQSGRWWNAARSHMCLYV